MRAIQTKQFRSGYHLLVEPVRVMKYGVEIGVYLPSESGREGGNPRFLVVAVTKKRRRVASGIDAPFLAMAAHGR